MSEMNAVDFGSLEALIGVWNGDGGRDVAPDPDGEEINPYFETITYSTVGNVTNAEGRTVIAVAAHIDDDSWNIIQSLFMQENATTISFKRQVVVGNGSLYYAQTTMIKIYGKTFEHTEQNSLAPA